MVNTAGLHTGTGLFKSPLMAGLRMMKYQTRPYDELLTMVAATVHPSDSLTKAAPATRQKPTSGTPNRMNIKGTIPFGISPRLRTRVDAAMTRVPQGMRNNPMVEAIFEMAYCR